MLYPVDDNSPGEVTRRQIDWSFVVAGAALVLGRMVFYHITQYTSDDAFITYRYARNLAEGLGFVYNIGERVQGTSSPLYTLWLAGASALLGPETLPAVSRLSGIAADLATLWLLWSLIPGGHRAVRWLVALIIILYPKIVLIGISGMEAPAVTMLMLLSWHFFRKRRYDAGMLFCALLLLTRVDSVLWIVLVLATTFFVERERIPLRAVIAPVILYGAWVLFSQFYFGSWVPHSVMAKNTSWGHLFPSFDPLRIMLGYLPAGVFSALPRWVELTVLIALLVPVMIEGMYLWRERSAYLLFPAFFLSYNLAYSLGRVLMPDWYYYPGYIAYAGIVGLFLMRVERSLRLSVRAKAAYGPVIAAALLLLIGYHLAAQRWAENLGGLFSRQNRQLGLWLKEHAAPGASVIVEPIGIIGWESGLYIYDYIGLVSPQVVAARKQNPFSDRWYSLFLQEHQPGYVVQRNWEFEQNELFHGRGDGMFVEPEDRQWFLAHYLPVQWNPHAARQDSIHLVLFEYADTGPLLGARK